MGRLITPDDWRVGETWLEMRERQIKRERRARLIGYLTTIGAALFLLYCACWVACGGGQP